MVSTGVGRGCVRFGDAESARRFHETKSAIWGDNSNGRRAAGLALDGRLVVLDAAGTDEDVGALLYLNASEWASRSGCSVEQVRFVSAERLILEVREIEAMGHAGTGECPAPGD